MLIKLEIRSYTHYTPNKMKTEPSEKSVIEHLTLYEDGPPDRMAFILKGPTIDKTTGKCPIDCQFWDNAPEKMGPNDAVLRLCVGPNYSNVNGGGI